MKAGRGGRRAQDGQGLGASGEEATGPGHSSGASKAPSFQNCRHHMEVGRWLGHRAGRLLYPPSEACSTRSQMDEGRVEKGRSLWWQRRRAGRGGGLPVVGSAHRGRSALTSPSLASRPACPCWAHLLCRPASPELRWALRCGAPMGLLCQGSASAPAQRPGGEGQDWRCACGGRGIGSTGQCFQLRGAVAEWASCPTAGLRIELGTFNIDGWGQASDALAWGPGREPPCRVQLRLAQGAPGVLGKPRPLGRLQLGCSPPGARLHRRGT